MAYGGAPGGGTLAPILGRGKHIEMRYREQGVDTNGVPWPWSYLQLAVGINSFTLDDAIYAGRTYIIQARSVDDDYHIASDWTEIIHSVSATPDIEYLKPLSVTATGVADGIAVSWVITGRTPSGTSFVVERAPDVSGAPGTFAPVTTTKSLFFTDGILDGGLYWYRVKAVTFNGGSTTYVGSLTATKAKKVADGADVSTETNPNSVTNPFFEAGDYGWTKGNGWAIIQTINAMSGDWYAVKNSGDANSILSNDAYTPLVAGQQVTARTYVKSTSATGAIQAGIQWLDANRVLISTTYGTPIAPASAVMWTVSEAQANAPANAVFYKVIVNVTGYSTGQWAVDNVYSYLSSAGLTDEERNALQQLTDFTSDGKLVPAEKDAIIRDYQALINVYPTLIAQANSFNQGGEITSQINAYTAAIANLKAYMMSLGPTGHNLTDPLTDQVIIDWCGLTSDVDGPTLRARFISAYTTESAIRDGIETLLVAGTAAPDLTGINTQLSDLAADNRLTPAEKGAVIVDMRMLFDEYGDVILKANQFVTVSTAAYVAAIAALDTYCRNPIPTPPNEAVGSNGLGVAGTVGTPPTSSQYTNWLSLGGGSPDSSGTIRIAAGTFRDRFATAFLERQKLFDAMHNASRQTAADAMNELVAIADDNQLTPAEKGAVVRDFKSLIEVRDALVAQAGNYNNTGTLTTLIDAYNQAINALRDYMIVLGLSYPLVESGGTPPAAGSIQAWCASITPIVGSNFRAYFAAAYVSETNLRNGIEGAIQSGATFDPTSINNQLNDLCADNRLTYSEKAAIVVDMRALYGGHADLQSKAQAAGVGIGTPEYYNYDQAMLLFDTYCRTAPPNGLGVPGAITNPITIPTTTQYNSWLLAGNAYHTIDVDGPTLRDRFGVAYQRKQELMNRIDGKQADDITTVNNRSLTDSGRIDTLVTQQAALAGRLSNKIRFGLHNDRPLPGAGLEDGTLWFDTDSTPPYAAYKYSIVSGWSPIIGDRMIVTSMLAVGAVVADIIAANQITGKHLVVADFTNLCGNPNGDEYDASPSFVAHGWDSNPAIGLPGLISADRTAFDPQSTLPAGSRGIRLQNAQYGYYGQWFEVKQNDEFWLEFDVNTNGAGGLSCTMGMVYSTSAVGVQSGYLPFLDTSNNPISVSSGVNSIRSFGGHMVIPPGAKWARLYVGFIGGSAGTIYFRNVIARRRANANLIVDGAVEARSLHADALVTSNYTSQLANPNDPNTEYALTGAKMRKNVGAGHLPAFLIDPQGMKIGQTLVSEAFFAREDSRYMYLSTNGLGVWTIHQYEAYKGVGAAPACRVVTIAGKGNVLELHWPQLSLGVGRLFGFVNPVWGNNADHSAFLTYQLHVAMTSVGYSATIGGESRVCLGLAFYHMDPGLGWQFINADQLPYSVGLMAGIRGFSTSFVL